MRDYRDMLKIFLIILGIIIFNGCAVRRVEPDLTVDEKVYAIQLEKKSEIDYKDHVYNGWGEIPFLPIEHHHSLLLSEAQRCVDGCQYKIDIIHKSCLADRGYFDGYRWIASILTLTFWPLEKRYICSGQVNIKSTVTSEEVDVPMQFKIKVWAGAWAIFDMFNSQNFTSRSIKPARIFSEFERRRAPKGW